MSVIIKKIFYLNNFGNHTRDFTYIGDVVKILKNLLLNNKKLKDKDILNICSNKPINLGSVILFMKKILLVLKLRRYHCKKLILLKLMVIIKKLKNMQISQNIQIGKKVLKINYLVRKKYDLVMR